MQPITTIGLDIASQYFKSTASTLRQCGPPASAEAAMRGRILPIATTAPGRYRSLRFVASLVTQTPVAWPHRSPDAACLALCEARRPWPGANANKEPAARGLNEITPGTGAM
jgi:hypothetical protein